MKNCLKGETPFQTIEDAQSYFEEQYDMLEQQFEQKQQMIEKSERATTRRQSKNNR